MLYSQARRIVLLILFVLAAYVSTRAQLKKDTLYYDENWSICEKPVANYYRLATLSLGKTILFVDTLTDYFLNGKIEMQGVYDKEGYKNGLFTFYRQDGSLVKQGHFVKDEMKGKWSFYDSSGNVRTILDCKSAVDFTPILIIDAENDTVVKNGEGHFYFNSKTDMPGIFHVSSDYTVEGTVVNGKKEGVFNYWLRFETNPAKIYYTETYKNGEFKHGKQPATNLSLGKPIELLNLNSRSKLSKTDVFYHSNIVFGLGKEGDQKVVRFLMYNELPQLVSTAKNYGENIYNFFDIFGTVFREGLKTAEASHVNYTYPYRGNFTNLLSFSKPYFSNQPVRNLKLQATFTIDETGSVVHSYYEGNIRQDEIEKINYYVSTLSSLVPLQVERKAVNSEYKVNIATYIDTISHEGGEMSVHCRYVAFNADSAAAGSFNRSESMVMSTVDLPAQPVGGTDALKRFLSTNLNVETLIKNKAPNGRYTVEVSFIVDEKGQVTDVKAVNDPGYGTAEEAVRVVNMLPDWIPAKKDGKSVPFKGTQFISLEIFNQ
jgi:hypothetical protein